MDTSFSVIPTKKLNLVPWKKKPFQSGDLLIKREFAPVGANFCTIVLTSWSPPRMLMGVGGGGRQLLPMQVHHYVYFG